MKYVSPLLACLLGMLFISCQGLEEPQTPLDQFLQSDNQIVRQVLDDPASYGVQILISEWKNDQWVDYSYRVDDSTYFYPASTIKLPVLLASMEQINARWSDLPVTALDSMVLVRPHSVDTVMDLYKDILAVSSNDAFNALYGLIGPDSMHESAERWETPLRLSHRLATTDAYNKTTGEFPIQYLQPDGRFRTLHRSKVENQEPEVLRFRESVIGKGYTTDDGTLIQEPFDFTKRNYYPLTSQHRILKSLTRPDDSSSIQFDIPRGQLEWLVNTMRATPAELGYDATEFPDNHVKFILHGNGYVDGEWTTAGKIGMAYGTVTESCILSKSTGEHTYVVSATIRTNENQIYNDGLYEYQEVAMPFLTELGKCLILTKLGSEQPNR